MKLLIPTEVVNKVKFSIDSELDFISLTEKQKSNLNKTLLSLWYFIYNEQRNDENTFNLKGFTNIHSKFFNKFSFKFNKTRLKYKQLLEILSNNNIITQNKKFSAGGFSQSYRIESDLINTNYSEVEIDFDKIFYNFKNKSYWLKKYPDLKKQINETYEVKIDLGEYIIWMNNNIDLELKPIMNNGILKKRFLTKERIYDYTNDALRINYDNIWFKLSNEGRFYNSTTNLSYTALPFIKLKRRSVREIDIANCQPLILSKLINNESYKNDCEMGIFYDRLSEELNITRNEAKVLSYKYIFFSNKKLKSGKIYDCMKKLYGDVIEQINDIRDRIEISKEMQKIESDIFVNKISSLDFKMMLRHDAVYVYEEDYEIVKKYVIKEFNRIGLNPTIK